MFGRCSLSGVSCQNHINIKQNKHEHINFHKIYDVTVFWDYSRQFQYLHEQQSNNIVLSSNTKHTMHETITTFTHKKKHIIMNLKKILKCGFQPTFQLPTKNFLGENRGTSLVYRYTIYQYLSPFTSCSFGIVWKPSIFINQPMVAWNRGTPKSSIFRWDFPWNKPTSGAPQFMETPILEGTWLL